MSQDDKKYDILEDDRYSEVFIDLENGGSVEKIKLKEKKQEENKSDSKENTTVSLDDLYSKEKPSDHFMNKLAMELEHIKNENEKNRQSLKSKENEDRYFSNSPLTMSLCSSHMNSDYEDSMDGSTNSKRHPFKKLTYQEV